MDSKQSSCPLCYFSRVKRDICGTYCTGGLENPDGTCDRYIYCHDKKAIGAFKTQKDAIYDQYKFKRVLDAKKQPPPMCKIGDGLR